MSTYEWSIDIGKRTAKCKAKTCFYGGGIDKGECRIKKSFENPKLDHPSHQFMHVDCYLNTTLTMRETTERVTSDSLPEVEGWKDKIDEDLRKRVLKFFTDWEAGNHSIRWDPENVADEEKEEEQEEEEEEGTGKQRKPAEKAKKPAKKAKKKNVEELEEVKEPDSDHVYLENTQESHNKFYEIWTKGSHVITKYGAIPSYSASKPHIKTMDDEEAATIEMEKTIKQKTSKGKGYSKAQLPS